MCTFRRFYDNLLIFCPSSIYKLVELSLNTDDKRFTFNNQKTLHLIFNAGWSKDHELKIIFVRTLGNLTSIRVT